MFDYSSEDLYKFIIRKENGEIIIDNLTDGDQITPFIDEENPESDIESVVVGEIIKEYYYVINKITKNGQIVYDKFGTRVIAEKDRPKFYGAGLECSICGIDFEANTPACIVTPCNHVIHCSCLDGWISTGNGHNTCPICRKGYTNLVLSTFNYKHKSSVFGLGGCSSVAGHIRYLRGSVVNVYGSGNVGLRPRGVPKISFYGKGTLVYRFSIKFDLIKCFKL